MIGCWEAGRCESPKTQTITPLQGLGGLTARSPGLRGGVRPRHERLYGALGYIIPGLRPGRQRRGVWCSPKGCDKIAQGKAPQAPPPWVQKQEAVSA